MLTVRFPDGFSIQYNQANYVTYSDSHQTLWKKTSDTNKRWIANVPYSCIVEASEACRLYNPVAHTGDVIGWLMDNMRRLSYSELGKLAQLKLALKDFNAQHRRWK